MEAEVTVGVMPDTPALKMARINAGQHDQTACTGIRFPADGSAGAAKFK